MCYIYYFVGIKYCIIFWTLRHLHSHTSNLVEIVLLACFNCNIPELFVSGRIYFPLPPVSETAVTHLIPLDNEIVGEFVYFYIGVNYFSWFSF